MKQQQERHYIRVPLELRDEMKQAAKQRGVSLQKIAGEYVRQILSSPTQPKFNEGGAQIIADISQQEALQLRKVADKKNVRIAAYIRSHYEQDGFTLNMSNDNISLGHDE